MMKHPVKRVLAVILAVSMAISMFAVQSFAATSGLTSKKKYKNIVILGDSIASGYGMDGEIDALSTQMTVHHGELVKGSWPQLLGDAVATKSTVNLAREGFATANFCRMLSPEYEHWINQPENWMDRFMTETNFLIPMMTDTAERNRLMVEAREDVKKADAVFLQLGVNETGTYAFMAPILKTLYYTFGMALQPALVALEDDLTLASPEQLLSMIGSYQQYGDELETGIANFKRDYDCLVSTIHELNPTCDIYAAGVFNMFRDADPQGSDIQQFLSSTTEYSTGVCNNYMRKGSPYSKYVTYVDVSDTQIHQSASIDSVDYWLHFIMRCHPDATGHRFIAQQFIKAINGKDDTVFPSLTNGSEGLGVYNKTGHLRTAYNGLAKKGSKIYYVKEGKIASNYTGMILYKNKRYYIQKGVWQSSYDGTFTSSSYVYTIRNGLSVSRRAR